MTSDAPESIFCSEWAPTYGNPYLEAPTAPADTDVARIVEDDGVLRTHSVLKAPDATLVFVDGVRRMEAHLTAERSGTAVRGVSGAHGVGAVMCAPDHVPTFERCESRRYLVWEGPILVYRVGEESGQYVARLCDNTLGDGCDVVPGAGLNRRTLEQGVEGKRPSARGQRYLDRCMVPRQVTGT